MLEQFCTEPAFPFFRSVILRSQVEHLVISRQHISFSHDNDLIYLVILRKQKAAFSRYFIIKQFHEIDEVGQ